MGIFFGKRFQYYALAFVTAAITGSVLRAIVPGGFLAPRQTSLNVVLASVGDQDSYVMDGGVGPCSVDLIITDGQGKPVFAALVNVHIAYGFGGFHKLDLSVYSNNDGKAKFTGLPERVHKPPLEFRAKKDDATGIAIYNPATECHGQHQIVLQKPKQ